MEILGVLDGPKMTSRFNDAFRHWIQVACSDRGYDPPPPEFYSKVYARLPEGIRTLIGWGIEQDLVDCDGETFTVPGSNSRHSWFSHYRGANQPNPNWEYFLQVAEYVRLCPLAAAPNCRLAFEDHLMDLSLYNDDELLVCIEIKEQSQAVRSLLESISTHSKGVDLQAPDRGNDGLRKAKYLLEHRPRYLCLLATGVRYTFRVNYPASGSFKLNEDHIPYI